MASSAEALSAESAREVDPSWYLPGGIMYLPCAARSALEAFDVASGTVTFQPIVILDQWLPLDRVHPDVPVTPSVFWNTIVTPGHAQMAFQGDVIPCSLDDVIVQHDLTPFLPPPLRRPPVASTQTWTPRCLSARSGRWAYHGRVRASLDAVEVGLCGATRHWLDITPAVAYARGYAFINVVCGDVQYVLWRPASQFSSQWWTWIGAQLGLGDDGPQIIPDGMGPTVHDPLPLRRLFQLGAAGQMPSDDDAYPREGSNDDCWALSVPPTAHLHLTIETLVR